MTIQTPLRPILAILLAGICLLAASPATAEAPTRLPIQGVLADAQGVPLDGNAELTLRVYDGANALLFTHVTSIALTDGEFTAYLGDAQNPVDLSLFRDYGDLELGISVDGGTELSPRFPIASAAYAGFAAFSGQANSVDWADVAGVPAGFGDGSDADTLAGLSCSSGQQATWSGSAWTCATDSTSFGALTGVPSGLADGDDDTTYTAGTGLSLNGATFSVGANAITGAHIATDAISSMELLANSVGSSEIAANAVGASEIATGAVGAFEIASDAVGRSELAHDIFRASTSLHPSSVQTCSGAPFVESHSVSGNTYELCILSRASTNNSAAYCEVGYSSTSNEWTLYSGCPQGTAKCRMTCFSW